VGYLPDGTMVVVENSQKNIGQSIEVEFIRSLQTAAGRMMFAKPIEKPVQQKQPPKQKPIGKKPLAQQSQPQVTQTSKVYHSDKQDQTTVSKQSQKQPTSQHRHQNNKTQAQYNRQPKSQRSNDRESTLMDLVNKQ
jgi:hypothetical protein